MTHHDAQQESRSAQGTRTRGWQPSRRDYSRATYSASVTGYPKASGKPKTPAGRRYGRIAMTLAAFVGVVALGVFFSGAFEGSRAVAPPTLAPEPVAVLELTHGRVYTVAGGQGLNGPGLNSPGLKSPALAVGHELEAGAVVETPNARAALRLASGPSVRLDTGSRVRLASASEMVLERGAVYVDSASGSGVEVRTSLGVVRDIGTQFEVRLLDGEREGASLRIRVREGSIVLRQDGGEPHEAIAGDELAMAGDGSVERGRVEIHGPQWNWVQRAAPAPAIEGEPLAGFLDWVIREGGWELRFADEETAALASTTILHGDIAGLAPIEAANMVFESSGLEYELRDETFVVARKKTV